MTDLAKKTPAARPTNPSFGAPPEINSSRISGCLCGSRPALWTTAELWRPGAGGVGP
jgi:hypothetical protein